MLFGRGAERERIGTLLDEAWAARGGALVLRGQPGAGKSALLHDAIERADGTTVLLTEGIESESPLAFAALQRLLRPAMIHSGPLPEPQANALRTAFGEQAGGGGDRFLVFLATLSLLAEVAEDAPVLCVVDDAHWLDDASAAALTFVARRLGPERVAMLFAARDGDVRQFDSAGLPEMIVGGLDNVAAGQLLSAQAGVTVSDDVRDSLMRQTGGNPLALVELPALLSAEQLGGGRHLPPELPLTEGVQRVFLDRSRRLSVEAQTLLLVAAADDSTRLAVVRQAADILGVGAQAWDEAERSELLQSRGTAVKLRHPLVRSALYQSATSLSRREAHRALAQVMTDARDVDRRAWHLAAAADQPDLGVVAELDRAAERAHDRGGYEASSAAFERAAEFTSDDAARAQRLLAAATNSWLAGQLSRARSLLDDARPRSTDPLTRADIDRLRGRIELNIGSVAAAVRIWTDAAREIAIIDRQRAREIAMIAAAASTFMPEDSRTNLDPAEVLDDSSAASPARVQCFTSLLVGFHHLLRGELSNAAGTLTAAFSAGYDLVEPDLLSNMGIAAFHLGDDDAFRRSFTRLLAQSRDNGAVGLVLFALPRLALADLCAGQWDTATSHAAEALQLANNTGHTGLALMPLAELTLHAALRGDDDYDTLLSELERALRSGPSGILGELVQDTKRWAQGCHAAHNAQADSALHHLEQMTQDPLIRLAGFDRLDAAFRANRLDTLSAWLVDYERFADSVETPRARALASYGHALISAGPTAEAHYRDALAIPAATIRPYERARTQLAYGEFLRRERRRLDARAQLRSALSIFEDLGAQRWAQRARNELRASGESARKRDPSTATDLTAQERQVATLVAEGMTNREVAAQLFLSPRTIDFHLRNVFAKAGISSRGEVSRLNLG